MATIDFHYTFDGMFYSIFPVSKDAEQCWHAVIQQIGFKFLPHIFESFKEQAKTAGYTVRKSPRITMSDEKLMAALS